MKILYPSPCCKGRGILSGISDFSAIIYFSLFIYIVLCIIFINHKHTIRNKMSIPPNSAHGLGIVTLNRRMTQPIGILLKNDKITNIKGSKMLRLIPLFKMAIIICGLFSISYADIGVG
ncbi:MAG: hypothetical protein JW704_11350, partial [Anaerolineaceae bacterium]|nr:hypothetical protein [Anaerolineaceae bacterium]